jgi:hypothetical protein
MRKPSKTSTPTLDGCLAAWVCLLFLLLPTSAPESEARTIEKASKDPSGLRGPTPQLTIEELDRIVQPIMTITEHENGVREYNKGSGFIMGERFYTANHNLMPAHASPSRKRTSYLEGVPIKPLFTDPDQDIAIFPVPDILCARLCNHVSSSGSYEFAQDRRVFWLRKFEREFVLKRGRILYTAIIGGSSGTGDPDDWNCDANLVILVDEPFVPGSSGAPIMDAATGRIIGVIQGSFETRGTQTGYFKPIECVVSSL